ncbi:hypothetical protein AB6B38_14645 (plasmid) [Glycocaulis abyssi]|uniref:Uncharacterized protein n=1 Tax=Glycocaulis abyssi TaxID=1433403 RepID=A0ABV9NHT3_9PROT
MFETESEAGNFAKAFVEQYIAVGFGVLTKREIDLLVLKLLHKHAEDFNHLTDFDVARKLRTTKRKIRSLRDELSFREAGEDVELSKQLRKVLKHAEVLKSDNSMVMVQIDDAVLRGYAERVLRSQFAIVDTDPAP